ncbi:cysteinyl-tRNA synthetase [Afipia sp. P52-10]|uniref:cysteine--tRNA ligase n=1 Tax=Afipia sp. P52-10 TaxID=1429916 RepID=UPI0003DF0582|nr:cysteine--tRNA ligase [Afipia sp. P52-10]ETR74776.1 cysteinyl-tRNA synthetase [Afipia sp. P52-10]
MELRFHDTMTKEKRRFQPLDPENVRMYVCGPTVYDFAHIGNARPVIVFDVLFRLLRHVYGDGHVTYVRNITDVDDKINDRAARDYPALPLNEAIRKVTELTGSQFHADVDALGALRPTVEPRATEHIAEMREIIEKLIANGNAYVEQDHVLFSVGSMPDYGKLSRRSLDEMIAGARVDVAPYKRDAMDFVLWKPSKAGEPSWPSPGGIEVEGRPGWHIECSAMAWKHLGEQFDIHGGGIDLVFPHHENEIAQSCCAFHANRMAQVWMHNGFLQVEGDKMSKSLGNFVTIRELLDTDKFAGRKWSGEVLRLAMLRTHYRQPIDWTAAALEESRKTLDSWYDLVGDETKAAAAPDAGVLDALGDDLNTASAIARLHAIAAEVRAGTGDDQVRLRRKLKASAMIMGLLSATKAEYIAADPQVVAVDAAAVEALIAARAAARAEKNWKESDRIRDQLAAMKVVLKDGKDASGTPVTTWEIAR